MVQDLVRQLANPVPANRAAGAAGGLSLLLRALSDHVAAAALPFDWISLHGCWGFVPGNASKDIVGAICFIECTYPNSYYV